MSLWFFDKGVEEFIAVVSAHIEIGTVIAPLAKGTIYGTVHAQAFIFFEPDIDDACISFRFVPRAWIGDDVDAVNLFGWQVL